MDLKKLIHGFLKRPRILRMVLFTIKFLHLSAFVSKNLEKIGFWNAQQKKPGDLPENYLSIDDRTESTIEWLKS